jgi:hypothetical protein
MMYGHIAPPIPAEDQEIMIGGNHHIAIEGAIARYLELLPGPDPLEASARVALLIANAIAAECLRLIMLAVR